MAKTFQFTKICLCSAEQTNHIYKMLALKFWVHLHQPSLYKMKKLGSSEVKWLAQGHTTSYWWSYASMKGFHFWPGT